MNNDESILKEITDLRIKITELIEVIKNQQTQKAKEKKLETQYVVFSDYNNCTQFGPASYNECEEFMYKHFGGWCHGMEVKPLSSSTPALMWR